jgi:hypothetical protein
VPGTVISSADVNADLSDIASALTASLASNGETSITAQLRGIVSSTPTWSFVGDVDTGFGSDTADQAYVKAGGVKTLAVSTTGIVVTGQGTFSAAVVIQSGGFVVQAGGITITAGGLIVSAGGAVITGDTSVAGTFSATGVPSFTSTSHILVPLGTTAQRPSPGVGFTRFNSTLGTMEWFDGAAWQAPGRFSTFQRLTSGSGTFTTSVGARRLRIRMIAGGGGGAAAQTNAGAAGGTTSFESWTCGAGGGGTVGGAVGAGGTGGANGTGTLLFRASGARGGANASDSASIGRGGSGAMSQFGGGQTGLTQNGQAGAAGPVNTGSGGGGGAASSIAGCGGGAGEYVEFYIDSPAATYAYAVGAAGTGGAAGLAPGGNGGSGFILVEEFY